MKSIYDREEKDEFQRPLRQLKVASERRTRLNGRERQMNENYTRKKVT